MSSRSDSDAVSGRVPHQVDEAHGALHRHDRALRIRAPHPLRHGDDLATEYGVERRHEIRQQGFGELGVLLDDVEVGVPAARRGSSTCRRKTPTRVSASRAMALPVTRASCSVASSPSRLLCAPANSRTLAASSAVTGKSGSVGSPAAVMRRRVVGQSMPGGGRHLAQGERPPRAQGHVEGQLAEVGGLATSSERGPPLQGIGGSARVDRRASGAAGSKSPRSLQRRPSGAGASSVTAPACPTCPSGRLRAGGQARAGLDGQLLVPERGPAQLDQQHESPTSRGRSHPWPATSGSEVVMAWWLLCSPSPATSQASHWLLVARLSCGRLPHLCPMPLMAPPPSR